MPEGHPRQGGVRKARRKVGLFGISRAAVSQHLKVLRESGFASVRVDGPRRIYAIDAAPLQEVDAWLERFRDFWRQRLDALATEVARGKRKRGPL
nr:ArsR family transcriptional regulator [Luteimonas saliphila]